VCGSGIDIDSNSSQKCSSRIVTASTVMMWMIVMLTCCGL